MKNFRYIIIQFTVYFHVLLFTYAAISKLLDFENFQIQLAQSPLLSAYAGIISYAVITIELLIALLLCINKTRLFSIYGTLFLMTGFTVYIYLILNYSDFIPCSCGGILEKLDWSQHLVFNFICVILSLLSIYILEKSLSINWKQTFVFTFFTILLSSVFLYILFINSEYIIKKENNFTRRFIPHPISNEKNINLKASTFYFAGNNGDTIFLGNRKAPLLLTTINPDFKNYKIDTLKISEDRHPFKKVELSILYPNYSIADGSIPIIFEGKFPNLHAKKVSQNKFYFTKIKMIAPHQYVIKATLTKNKKAILGTINTTNNENKINEKILKPQLDGIFDTDGNISFDVLHHNIIYTYLYRNQYIITDKNLLHTSTGNTIDTTKIAKIKLYTSSDGITKLAAPPIEVNEFQTVHNYILFNVSNLKGKFEPHSRWKDSKVIDVYHYQNKSYLYSFYIKNKNNKKTRSILATQNYFYALIGNDIVRYKRRK